jgi:hypothetical protein
MSRFASLQPTAPLNPTPAADVDAAEAQLGVRFPSGYREFVTMFGRGVLGGVIRIYAPRDILSGVNNLSEWRQRIDEYWFWDESADLLSKQRALECVILGDTVGGDEFVFHPADPDAIYVLPHDFETAWRISAAGLEPAVDWFFTSGVLDEPFENSAFEPY